jgi:hypothetical protein
VIEETEEQTDENASAPLYDADETQVHPAVEVDEDLFDADDDVGDEDDDEEDGEDDDDDEDGNDEDDDGGDDDDDDDGAGAAH